MAEPKPTPDFLSKQVREARYYFLDAPGSSRAPLRVICGGCEYCQPDYRVQRRTFEYHCIEYVMRGRGHLMLAGKQYKLRPGIMFSYGPGISHIIRADPDDPPTKYFVDFTGRGAKQLLQSADLPCGSCRALPPVSQVHELMELLISNGSRQTPQTAEVCRTLLRLIVLKMGEPAAASPEDPTGAHETYLACRAILDQHFLKLRSLEDLATRCSIDPAYLCRLFKQFDSCSPYQALLRLKMNYAATALIKSGRLVKQVAREVGYEDPYQFSRIFKRVHGSSPKAFMDG